MALYAADALVLRSFRYGEANRIVVFLTEDRGKKRGVALNASASRRRFGGALESLTRGRVTYVEREQRELVRLDRIEPSQSPLQSFGRPGSDGARVLGHAAYFAELIDEWAPENQPNTRVFRLGAAVADALVDAVTVDALARYFEYWLLRLEGVYPAVDRCPRCGETSLGDGSVFVAGERAYLCHDCAGRGARMSAAAMAFLQGAARRTPRDAAASHLAAGPLRELEEAHHLLIGAHLEKDVRSASVLRELRAES